MSRCRLSLQGYGGDAVANRLRKTLVRIVNQSLTQYKAGVIASRPAHASGSQQGKLCCSSSLHYISQHIYSFSHSCNQSINQLISHLLSSSTVRYLCCSALCSCDPLQSAVAMPTAHQHGEADWSHAHCSRLHQPVLRVLLLSLPSSSSSRSSPSSRPLLLCWLLLVVLCCSAAGVAMEASPSSTYMSTTSLMCCACLLFIQLLFHKHCRNRCPTILTTKAAASTTSCNQPQQNSVLGHIQCTCSIPEVYIHCACSIYSIPEVYIHCACSVHEMQCSDKVHKEMHISTY